jgi:hypothetical protein
MHMNAIRTLGALDQLSLDNLAKPQALPRGNENEIRTLEDWELLLAGGGEDMPDWS